MSSTLYQNITELYDQQRPTYVLSERSLISSNHRMRELTEHLQKMERLSRINESKRDQLRLRRLCEERDVVMNLAAESFVNALCVMNAHQTPMDIDEDSIIEWRKGVDGGSVKFPSDMNITERNVKEIVVNGIKKLREDQYPRITDCCQSLAYLTQLLNRTLFVGTLLDYRTIKQVNNDREVRRIHMQSIWVAIERSKDSLMSFAELMYEWERSAFSVVAPRSSLHH